MKRNENLVPLSKDHHFGLLCVWKIRMGLKKGISYDRIRKYINYFWQKNLHSHFEVEDIVLPEIENASLLSQMEKEHVEIHRLINTINQSEDERLLLDFANALQSHIRFEERVVFPNYEEMLSADQLDEIGNLLTKFHHKEEDDYADEFWK